MALEEAKPAPSVPLTESPNSVMTERSESPNQQEEGSPSAERQQRQFIIIPEEHQLKNSSNLSLNLHPYTRPLTISDLESCVALEDAAFTNPEERATREKASPSGAAIMFLHEHFEYRLSSCGELCLGIFCTVVPGSGVNAETLATGKPVETSRHNGAISVLLGHVVAAKTNDPVASDQSMGVPEDWNSPHPKPSNLGHQEAGRTIVVHSVAILPAFQGRGLGRVLMMAYMQQMNGAGIADRLALIARDHKLAWYEKLGFSNKGKSKARFGGGGWYDLVFELKALEPRAAYG